MPEAYPTFAQQQGSTWMLRDDIRTAIAANGMLQQSGRYTELKHEGTLQHKLVADDKATLDDFYAANRILPITFIWAGDSVTYTARFSGPPRAEWKDGRWQVQVDLVEV